jgi:hypothetical protein
MATELLRPGVSVIQTFRSVSPTIVTPTLVPCAIAPAFQVLEALEQDATGNSVLNTDAVASVPGILIAANPGPYSGLDGLILKVSVNNGAVQEFIFSDPTSVGLSVGAVKDQIAAESPAPSGFGAYVQTVGASEYLMLRTTATGTGQTIKVMNGDANSVLGFNDFYVSEGVTTYAQKALTIAQANFPDPRGIIDELDVDESSIRVFSTTSGANLKEFKRDTAFLRNHKGATYTSGALTFAASTYDTKKFAFKYQVGGTTQEFAFTSEPADLAALVIAMNALMVGAGIDDVVVFSANGAVLDVSCTNGYFEVVAPSASSCHVALGWATGDKAFTVEPVDDGDGDTRTPFIVMDQENFNAPADSATITGTAAIASEIELHNKTFEVAVDGGAMQEVVFDAGPIVSGNVFAGTTLTSAAFGFNVNGVDKLVTFSGGDPIAIADAIAQINTAAGMTVCYESNASGVATPAGGYLAFQVGGATPIAGGSIYLDYSEATGTAWADLGLTGVVDLTQTISLAELIVQINNTMGAAFASDSSTYVKLLSTTDGYESKIEIGNGTGNALLGFTTGGIDYGTPFSPKVGDAVWADGALIGYIAVVMPGGYSNRLKLDREIAWAENSGWAYYYIQSEGISDSLPSDRPKPDLVIGVGGEVQLKHDFLRDTEGNPIVAEGSLIIAYDALRLDVTSSASEPALLNLDDTDDLEDALSPINTDNPLALMLYFMLINAPGVTVTGIGVDGTSSANPDGTPAAYTKALSFLESEEVYALAPASQDPIVHQLFMTHVDAQSDPDAKGERIVFINPEMPGEGLPELALSATDGDSTAVTNEFDTKVASLAADVLSAGVDPVGTIPVTEGLYLDIATDSKKYNISAISGTKVTIRVSFAPGENDDAFYSTDNLSGDLISETFSINVRGSDLVDSNGDPDYTAISEAYQGLGAAYANRRVIMVAPEMVGATIDSVEQRIPGYYMCAAIAGMVGQQPPQQGFTNFPISGFTRAFGSNDTFNQTQMNIGAAGGTYWVIQEVAGGPLTARHQLTTDLTSIETRELSITKVVDFTAKFMRAGLRNFIGKFNITQPFLDTLSTVVQGQLSFLTESGVIVGGDLNNIIQDSDAPDTVLIDVTLDVPYPCNYIRLTLVI